MKTPQEWWDGIKDSPGAIVDWLKDQYHGELTAHRRIHDFIVNFPPGDEKLKKQLTIIADQEQTHASWIADLLLDRNEVATALIKTERYWDKTLPGIDSFESGAATAAHAEKMRLERIKVLCADPKVDTDIRNVFLQILPQEEFHERAFREMAGDKAMAEALDRHRDGLVALNLLIPTE